MIDDSFGFWFAGLVDGEGCFHARAHIRKSDNAHCLVVYFALKMRADDAPMLMMVKDVLGTGKIYYHNEKISKHPQADYRVAHRDALSEIIIPLFDKYPLRSKKARDYQVWRQIVLDYKCAPRRHCGIGIGSLPDSKWVEVCQLAEQLRQVRYFDFNSNNANLTRQRVAMTQPPLFTLQPEQSVMELVNA